MIQKYISFVCLLGVSIILASQMFAQDAVIAPGAELTVGEVAAVENTVLADTEVRSPFVWNELIFDEARVSLAGPTALYMSDVKSGEKKIAFLIKKNEAGLWLVSETWQQDSGQIFPGQSFFDLANVSLVDGVLVINGVYMDKSLKKVSFAVRNDGALELDENFKAGEVVGKSLERSRDLGRIAYTLPEGEASVKETQALAEVGNLSRKNQDLVSQLESLEAEKVVLNTTISELNGALTANTAKNEELNASLAEKDKQLAELQSRNIDLTKEIENLKAELLAYSKVSDEAKTENIEVPEVDGLRAQILQLEAQLGSLQTKIADLEKLDLNKPVLKSIDEGELESLKAKIAELMKTNEALMADRQAIERELRAKFVASGFIATMKGEFTKIVLSGFKGGKSEIGTWKITPELVKQTNPEAYYSRFTLPLVQKQETMLYRFSFKSTGSGWLGAGLHLYAENSPLRGYGHGKSLLVWFTRDKETFGNDVTHLQMYRSDNDVVMGRVVDATISDNITTDTLVEIMYQPLDEYLTVAVNGVEKIRYKTWFDIEEGIEVALRTLDKAEFKNLEVLAIPPR